MRGWIKMRKRICSLFILILAFLISPGLFRIIVRAETSNEDQSWSFVLYNNNNGMPFSEANALQQTSEGFIYIGCYGGLLRFDGESFYRFEDSRLVNVISLFVDSRNRLWIGTNSNGFSIMENGGFSFYDKENGLDSRNIRCFAEDGKGNVLIGTRRGLYYFNAEGNIVRLMDPRLKDVSVDAMDSDQHGTIYALTANSEVFAIDDLEISLWLSGTEISKDIISNIYPDPERKGYVYFGLDVEGLLYGNPWAGKENLRHIDTPGLSFITDMLYSDGRLWIASDKGIGFINENQEFIRPDKMQRSNAAQSLTADMEGNIWVASYRLGVIKMSPSIFTNINSMANLAPRVVNTTHIKDGILYIGSDTGLVCLDQDYNRAETPVSTLLAKERIRCITQDRNRRLWFCTFGEQGLVCLEEDGTITQYTKENALFSNYVRDILEMKDGTLAVSVKGGLYFIKDKEIVSSLEDKQLPNQEILCMYEDRPGRLLLGTNGNGVYTLEDGKLHPLPGANALSTSPILRISSLPGSKGLWILSSTSLFILENGQLREISDIPNLHNYDIVFDQNDNAWILAADGIYIGNADDILAGETIRYTHYDYKSGLPFVVTPHCRNYLSDEGLLYMSGNDGVVRININQASEDHSNVQLTVPYIEIDNDTVYLTPGEKVILSSGVKRLWVHPFALSYSLNEPILSYQLDGFDEEMITAGRSELPSFIYTNLKGGSYTFRFALIDPSTGSVKKKIEIPIIKQKAYHEQISFWLFCIAMTAGIIVLCVKLYLVKETRKLEEKHEQNRIRTELSVARDIQASVLPRVFPAFPDRTEIDLYASMDPALEVAGDFYDFFFIDRDHLALVIADVSGKGVGAALFMMVAKNAIKNAALSGNYSSPGEILGNVNNKLCEDNEANLFVTVWLGILTLSTGKLVSANAGHEYPVLFSVETGFSLVKDKHGPALGVVEGVRYKEFESTLRRGDGIFVYTDGVPEATNAYEEMFGNERMVEALNRNTDKNPEGLLRGIRKAVDLFVGDAPQFDDLTMLAVKYFGAPAPDISMVSYNDD